RRAVIGLVFLCLSFPGLNGQQASHYEPSLDSLNHHGLPQWYGDAKLGIFVHWGLYSVPGWAPLFIRDMIFTRRTTLLTILTQSGTSTACGWMARRPRLTIVNTTAPITITTILRRFLIAKLRNGIPIPGRRYFVAQGPNMSCSLRNITMGLRS